MKKLLYILLFIPLAFFGQDSNLYHIPDTAFVSWLKENQAEVMVGDSLDINATNGITSLSLKPYKWYADIDIQNLDGIQFFTDLDSLNIYNLNLSTLPELPPSLTKLICESTSISNITKLPDGLTFLDCSDNNLSTLPELPSGLKYLDCSNNNISILPEFPEDLTKFYCTSNSIINLNELPVNLTKLDISFNRIITLPNLPVGLTYIDCSNNNISNLPELPDGLKYLYCSDNNITTLPDLPINLTKLDVSFNTITTLPKIPAGLIKLDVGSNKLTSIPKLPNGLSEFEFGLNDLKEVEVPIYKLFPTKNIYAIIKLNTRNGKLSQVHYSLSKEDFEGELSINPYSLVSINDEINGRFTLYPTQNTYNFILLDQIDGKTWQVQWNNQENMRFINRIY